jgi:hypothetical protein
LRRKIKGRELAVDFIAGGGPEVPGAKAGGAGRP